jgi:L-alanine-DL-glutamate epimerase-like enolase superfamily enzyme
MGRGSAWASAVSELLKPPLHPEHGYLVIPEGPGRGIELREEALGKYPPVDKVLDTPLGDDGSVQDR